MSQERIFKLFLQSSGDSVNTDHKYPELVPERCAIIAKVIAKSLQDSAKVKSVVAKEKRGKLLVWFLSIDELPSILISLLVHLIIFFLIKSTCTNLLFI